MTDQPTPPSPSSWRDTYNLVRDTRKDVLEAVSAVDGKVETLTARVDAIEVARARESGQVRAASTIAGVARSTVALMVSIVSAVVAVIAVISK